MHILNFGSLNIDKVYAVPHNVESGETISATSLSIYSGGKGLNQSLAIAKAGASVSHAGAIGKDGLFLKELLINAGVNIDNLLIREQASGHAIIQVTPDGKNSIIILAGANSSFTAEEVRHFFKDFSKDDILLLQNETSFTPLAIEIAHERGMKVAYNASPINDNVFKNHLEYIDIFLINEIEAKLLADYDGEYEDVLKHLIFKYPNAEIVMTLGTKGVLYGYQNTLERHQAYKVKAVDTTAAGDTFTGYFLACRTKGMTTKECLKYASMASAIAVTRNGAAPSIPTWDEVIIFEKEFK